MATLNLTKVFVTLISTGTSVSGQTARGRTETYTVPSEVRTYAAGRRRSITAAGENGTFVFQMLLVPRATVDTLRSWQGLLVQVRDHKGRIFYGTYPGVAVAEYVGRAAWDVSITLTAVTFDPSV